MPNADLACRRSKQSQMAAQSLALNRLEWQRISTPTRRSISTRGILSRSETSSNESSKVSGSPMMSVSVHGTRDANSTRGELTLMSSFERYQSTEDRLANYHVSLYASPK